MNKAKGFLALLSAGLILGSFSVFIRLLSRDLDVYQQVLLRNLIALVVSIVLIVVLRRFISFKKVPKIYLLLYIFSSSIVFFLYTVAVLKTSVSTAIFGLYFASLIFSLVAGIVIFSEKVTPRKIVALVLVFLALLIYTWPISLQNLLQAGFLFGVGAGLAEGMANGFRKYLGDKVDRLVLVAMQGLGAFILGSVLTVSSGNFSIPSMSPMTLIVLLVFGMLLVAMSYLTLVGFSNFDLNLGTIVLSSELLFAPLFAAIIFVEIPTLTQILGGVLILLAIIVLNLNLGKSKNS